jgi:hypothetical protein
MDNLPFKVGDWVRHKLLGKFQVDAIETNRVKFLDQYKAAFYVGLDRLPRMISSLRNQNPEVCEATDHPQEVQTLSKPSTVLDLPSAQEYLQQKFSTKPSDKSFATFDFPYPSGTWIRDPKGNRHYPKL